jgi:general secretion pathway protein K
MREALAQVPKARQSGIALIAVLGFLAVMSLITIAVVGAARSVVNSASQQLVRVQAQAAIESGVEWAAYTLAEARGTVPEILSGPKTIVIGGFTVRITARPERAKIDINFADEPLLAGAFRAGGADPSLAERLASAVEDWRDGDDLLHLNGAERGQYAQAGLNYAPANRLFQSVGELRLVLGMSREIFDCIRPQLTILTQSPGLDLTAADPSLLKVLGVERRKDEAGAAAPSLATGQLITPGDVYEIVAETQDVAHGIRRAERVSVRITGNPSDPFWMLTIEPEFPLRDAAARACPRTADE